MALQSLFIRGWKQLSAYLEYILNRQVYYIYFFIKLQPSA